MARRLMQMLQEESPERAARIDIADAVMAYGDPGLLEVVLQNLLGNAWKFTRQCEVAEIAFAVQTVAGERVYQVRDNGAGFDMAYAEKLFGVFQRLHGRQEFEGTGIGLATVQRVIHRHGGRIWAEAEVGRGATFFFTLAESTDRMKTGP
jgi:light-regulated signal transduction histidine kinase (bacteriophytochrome)